MAITKLDNFLYTFLSSSRHRVVESIEVIAISDHFSASGHFWADAPHGGRRAGELEREPTQGRKRAGAQEAQEPQAREPLASSCDDNDTHKYKDKDKDKDRYKDKVLQRHTRATSKRAAALLIVDASTSAAFPPTASHNWTLDS